MRYPARPGVPSENGWPQCTSAETVYSQVPGTTTSLRVRKGDAATILIAWCIWYHRNVEPIDLYKGAPGTDDWGYSADNDVSNSNHLSATAVDLNATQYPWGRRVMPQNRINAVREGLKLFEGTIFWGADWSRADEMHYQIGKGPSDPKIKEFANRLNNGYLGLYGPPDPLAFPLPRGSYYGPLDGGNESVSGLWSGDTASVRDGLKRWQSAVGIQATGVWERGSETERVARELQMAKGWQNAPGNGYVYQGEWDAVIREGWRPKNAPPVSKPDVPVVQPPTEQPSKPGVDVSWPNLDHNHRGIYMADVNQYRPGPLDESYPYSAIMFRACTGTTEDTQFRNFLKESIRQADAGLLDCFGVYCFWRGPDTWTFMKKLLGPNPHPKMFIMFDVESGKGSALGEVTGDQSAAVNAAIEDARRYMGNPKRVGGYLNNMADPHLWTNKPSDPWWEMTPDYSAPIGQPRKPSKATIFHQFSDKFACPPFGTCDMSFYPGTMPELLDKLGLRPLNTPEPTPTPETNDGDQNVADIKTRLGTLLDEIKTLLNKL